MLIIPHSLLLSDKKAFNFLRSSRAGFYFFCSQDKLYVRLIRGANSKWRIWY